MIGRMKKKLLILFLSLSVCTCYGCANNSAETSESFETAESAPIIQEVETLSDADIIIPAALLGDEISELTTEDSSLNEAESISNTKTISLTGEERTSIVNEISTEIMNNIQSILDNEDRYPNIVSITPNNDCTEFTISLQNGIMNTYESMLVMSFYMIGDKYQIYSGISTSEVKTTVTYINDDTGEIISKTDSTSMNTFTE